MLWLNDTSHSKWLRVFGLDLPWAAWSGDHGYFRRGIFGGSVLELYRISYAVQSAFLATATTLHNLLIINL